LIFFFYFSTLSASLTEWFLFGICIIGA